MDGIRSHEPANAPLDGTTANYHQRVKEELKIYMMVATGNTGDCPLEYWYKSTDRFTILNSIEKLVFTPPETSTPPKLVFSMAGAISRKRRSWLSPEITQLLFKVGQVIRNETK